MINGIAIILMLIVCVVIGYISFATGYESGKIDGYVEGADDGYNEGWAARGGDF